MSARSAFHPLLDAAPDAMIVVDSNGRVRALNLEAERSLGWTEQDLMGEPLGRVIPAHLHRPDDSDAEADGESPPDLRKGNVTCMARRQDGTEFQVELARRPLGHDRDAESLVTLRTLSERPNDRDTPFPDSELACATLDSIGDAIITTDTSFAITYLNPVAERLTGWSIREALGKQLDTVLHLIAELDRRPIPNTAARCLGEERSIDLEDGVLLVRRDGSEIPIGDSAAPVKDSLGRISGVVLVLQDESEKRRVGRRLSFEATHDALTGLVNRREFERRLTRVVGDLATVPADHVLLYLDLDGFKAVNDTCGHAAGDELLRHLGPLLTSRLRKRDTLARLGGDEFGVLLENCPMPQAERIAESLRAAVDKYELVWEQTNCSVGVSIGVIAVSTTSNGIAGVMKAADAAAYAAKRAGGNRVVHGDRAGRPVRARMRPQASSSRDSQRAATPQAADAATSRA